MNGIVRSISGFWPACAVLLVCSTAGCTSAISTAYLRDTFWESADHAAEAESTSPGDTDDMQSAVADDTASDGLASDETSEIDEERRAAAIDEAVQRLSKLGDLDEATQATLMETLQRTQQEDWPVVIEAFATSLEASGDSSRAAAEAVVERASATVRPASHVVAKADLDGTATHAMPPAEPAAAVTPAPAAPEPMPFIVESGAPLVPSASETVVTVAPIPSLAVRNACFASRVQAWGVVDRFAESRFRPGQELIVYFELDNLSAGESPAGHTTCIDTTLTLVDRDGRTLHDWSFEPIAETCRGKRHDYFARYVIRIPESVQAGDCRIDVAVVDTLAGTTARASLPLGIVN
ncbi:MAG: hypothetical protein ACR2IT_10950 [Pirellulales bacterium]